MTQQLIENTPSLSGKQQYDELAGKQLNEAGIVKDQIIDLHDREEDRQIVHQKELLDILSVLYNLRNEGFSKIMATKVQKSNITNTNIVKTTKPSAYKDLIRILKKHIYKAYQDYAPRNTNMTVDPQSVGITTEDLFIDLTIEAMLYVANSGKKLKDLKPEDVIKIVQSSSLTTSLLIDTGLNKDIKISQEILTVFIILYTSQFIQSQELQGELSRCFLSIKNDHRFNLSRLRNKYTASAHKITEFVKNKPEWAAEVQQYKDKIQETIDKIHIHKQESAKANAEQARYLLSMIAKNENINTLNPIAPAA